jgi:hypothetical protein
VPLEYVRTGSPMHVSQLTPRFHHELHVRQPAVDASSVTMLKISSLFMAVLSDSTGTIRLWRWPWVVQLYLTVDVWQLRG